MTVLIVDDSSVMRKVIGRTLAQTGIAITEILEAANGVEALAILRAHVAERAVPRLILTDISMPVMGGLEWVEQMRAEGLMPKVPVVMITTETSELQVRRALAAGVAGYIKKPFTSDQLKATVLRLVTTL